MKKGRERLTKLRKCGSSMNVEPLKHSEPQVAQLVNEPKVYNIYNKGLLIYTELVTKFVTPTSMGEELLTLATISIGVFSPVERMSW